MYKKYSPIYYLGKLLRNITIKQANLFVTFTILIFTVLFAYLLIQENYLDYEQTLKAEYQKSLEKERYYVKQILGQLESAMAYSQYDIQSIKQFAKVFDAHDNVINIFNSDDTIIYVGKRGRIIRADFDLLPNDFTTINFEGENILLFSRHLPNGLEVHIGVLTATQEVRLAQDGKRLKDMLIKNTLAIATLSFILFAIVLGLYNIFNQLLQHDSRLFLKFFKNGAHTNAKIDKNELYFKEFKQMVTYANTMIDTISEQKHSLKDLNAHLEERIEQKTKNLQQANEQLIEEKRFSENILAAQKEFLRYTVHETNTPLSIILTSIELYTMSHKKDRQLSKIEAAAKNIYRIYDDLSYLVKKDQIHYPKEAIDMTAFICSRIDFFEEVAHLSRVDFTYEHDQMAHYVYFNKTKLSRIIDNTLTNAIKYTLPSNTIYVKLILKGMHLYFSVSSHSKAIDNPDKIFEAYYRETQDSAGFGLGLQLVRTICDQEHIDITVTSSDEMTTFTYTFIPMGE